MRELELIKFFKDKNSTYLVSINSTDCDKVLYYLYRLSYILITGKHDVRFYNNFISESIRLLIHAINLFKKGYFDCAFYSARQSIEILNNMLYIPQNKDNLESWEFQKFFPSNSEIKKELIRYNKNYSEMKEVMKEIFDKYNELLKKANKYIHKQGYDTFYIIRKKKNLKKIKLFEEFIQLSLKMLLLIMVILDPLFLVLSDSEDRKYVHSDLMTNPIPTSIINDIFGCDIINKIKQLDFYDKFIKELKGNERLNNATYDVIHNYYFDINVLNDIENQIHILDNDQAICLEILKCENNISAISIGCSSYGTNIAPRYLTQEYIPSRLNNAYIEANKEKFINSEKNIEWEKMYLSVYQYKESNYIILQHNDKFDEKIFEDIQKVIDQGK